MAKSAVEPAAEKFVPASFVTDGARADAPANPLEVTSSPVDEAARFDAPVKMALPPLTFAMPEAKAVAPPNAEASPRTLPTEAVIADEPANEHERFVVAGLPENSIQVTIA